MEQFAKHVALEAPTKKYLLIIYKNKNEMLIALRLNYK